MAEITPMRRIFTAYEKIEPLIEAALSDNHLSQKEFEIIMNALDMLGIPNNDYNRDIVRGFLESDLLSQQSMIDGKEKVVPQAVQMQAFALIANMVDKISDAQEVDANDSFKPSLDEEKEQDLQVLSLAEAAEKKRKEAEAKAREKMN